MTEAIKRMKWYTSGGANKEKKEMKYSYIKTTGTSREGKD